MVKQVIASLGLCNVASLNIHEVDEHGDYVVVSVNNIKPRKHKLYDTNKGFYFKFGGCRYYLHEFMKC